MPHFRCHSLPLPHGSRFAQLVEIILVAIDFDLRRRQLAALRTIVEASMPHLWNNLRPSRNARLGGEIRNGGPRPIEIHTGQASIGAH